jgi:predicted nucleic acid-binding protein
MTYFALILSIPQNDLIVLMGGDLQVCPSKPLMPDALEIAVAVEQAVYDCVYLALA